MQKSCKELHAYQIRFSCILKFCFKDRMYAYNHLHLLNDIKKLNIADIDVVDISESDTLPSMFGTWYGEIEMQLHSLHCD